jgi:hypothetical protein
MGTWRASYEGTRRACSQCAPPSLFTLLPYACVCLPLSPVSLAGQCRSGVDPSAHCRRVQRAEHTPTARCVSHTSTTTPHHLNQPHRLGSTTPSPKPWPRVNVGVADTQADLLFTTDSSHITYVIRSQGGWEPLTWALTRCHCRLGGLLWQYLARGRADGVHGAVGWAATDADGRGTADVSGG